MRTFSEESLFTGGLFSFQPGVKNGSDADAQQRYSNTLADVALSAVRPGVSAVAPSGLPRATTLDVELTGGGTAFRPGSTVSVAGAGVAASVVSVLSPTRLVARMTVAAGAPLGFRDVQVDTPRGDGSTETARAIGAVQVVAAPASPRVLSLTPSAVPVGATRDVRISGALTHFGAGTTASFGPGVTVSGVTVESPTTAVAHVTVPAGAEVGFRDVSVQTGGETAGADGALLVAPPAPAVARLVSASPRSAVRGATVDVTLTGVGTSFADGSSAASVDGAGVSVLSTTVSSPSKAVARLKVAPGAPLGFRDLRVTTGAETAALLDGFEVRPKPVVSTPTPTPTPGRTPVPTPIPIATPSGTSSPPPCTPRVKLGTVRVKKRALQLRGSAACVKRVEVSISRAAGRGKCRFVTARGKLGRPRRCAKPVFVAARGIGAWRLKTKALPPGRYTLRVRGGATKKVRIRRRGRR